jgi:ABC-type transporter Mla MlaB component
MEMPEQLNSVGARTLWQELEPLLDSPGPRIILDCSAVRNVDGAGVAMMLHYLEEAMKRDGDLRLAAFPADSEAVVELSHVFEAFTTCDEAVNSFSNFPAALPRVSPCANHSANRGTLKQAS